MNRVTLCTINKQSVHSYDMRTIQRHCFPGIQNLVPIRNTDLFLDKQEIQIENIPVQKFCWHNGKEIYAAFDRELIELIGCTQEQKDTEVERLIKKRYNNLLEQLEAFENMTFWQRVKRVFKK